MQHAQRRSKQNGISLVTRSVSIFSFIPFPVYGGLSMITSTLAMNFESLIALKISLLVRYFSFEARLL